MRWRLALIGVAAMAVAVAGLGWLLWHASPPAP
jgi:hypothetical protein